MLSSNSFVNVRESDLNQALADEIIEGNLEKGTKVQYYNKIKHFNGWLYHNYPDSTVVKGGERTADLRNVTDEQLKEFFGHVAKKTKIRSRGEVKSDLWEAEYINPIQFQSYEHVSGYKSAIKDRFIKECIIISRDIENMMKEFFGSH